MRMEDKRAENKSLSSPGSASPIYRYLQKSTDFSKAFGSSIYGISLHLTFLQTHHADF